MFFHQILIQHHLKTQSRQILKESPILVIEPQNMDDTFQHILGVENSPGILFSRNFAPPTCYMLKT